MSKDEQSPDDIFTGLPCGEVVRKGVEDLEKGDITIESCLAAIASPRLKEAGILNRTHTLGTPDTEHTLYHLLEADHPDTHAAYNARLQELVSFENALDHRLLWEAGLPA